MPCRYLGTNPEFFNRRVKRIQRDWAARLENADEYEYLREEVGKRLVERLDDIVGHEFHLAVDLGCHSGLLVRHLEGRSGIRKLICIDHSEYMLERARRRNAASEKQPAFQIEWRLADEEELETILEPGSVDLVISNLSLHWTNALPEVFSQVRRVLRPDGVFLASLWGRETLRELAQAFALAEQERDGGLSAHVSPFAGLPELGTLLQAAGFTLPTLDQELLRVRYADAFALMRDLRAMGENNAVRGRRSTLPLATLLAAAAAYQCALPRLQHTGAADSVPPAEGGGGVLATFQVLYLVAWAPAPSQPLPKPRGSASARLRDSLPTSSTSSSPSGPAALDLESPAPPAHSNNSNTAAPSRERDREAVESSNRARDE